MNSIISILEEILVKHPWYSNFTLHLCKLDDQNYWYLLFFVRYLFQIKERKKNKKINQNKNKKSFIKKNIRNF
ncbi:hypothetical protein BpHYR1_046574 [Brachionus plicatilis]|uniref:Uncharacterized protein n=1 Tax=Brachionus plicatilis TaxID=10195 RepID=A0A3M7QDV1_BRAPC|nr:hypothetical protein BpHYR1_046574 [Brachionus plicatilis]